MRSVRYNGLTVLQVVLETLSRASGNFRIKVFLVSWNEQVVAEMLPSSVSSASLWAGQTMSSELCSILSARRQTHLSVYLLPLQRSVRTPSSLAPSTVSAGQQGVPGTASVRSESTYREDNGTSNTPQSDTEAPGSAYSYV